MSKKLIKFKILFNQKDSYDVGITYIRAVDRYEASQTGMMIYGDDFRCALVPTEFDLKKKKKPKISGF